jgi:hypothetical protein
MARPDVDRSAQIAADAVMVHGPITWTTMLTEKLTVTCQWRKSIRSPTGMAGMRGSWPIF